MVGSPPSSHDVTAKCVRLNRWARYPPKGGAKGRALCAFAPNTSHMAGVDRALA